MIQTGRSTAEKLIPKNLLLAQEVIYTPCKLECTSIHPETESREYDACRFYLNKKKVCYRTAKITPTKTGQFVTVWKRGAAGLIMPFDEYDAIDLLIVHVGKENHNGQFIFPKDILIQKGIFSSPGKEGKRAFRMYPPWDTPGNRQAEKSQKWQLEFYLDIPANTIVDLDQARRLLPS